MKKITSIHLAVLIVTIGIIASQSLAAPLSMSFYGDVGLTRVWRGDLASLGSGTFDTVLVIDDGDGIGGSDGVYSGFDLDFLIIDLDGNLATTADQILPAQAPPTHVNKGSIRNQTTSPYQPTVLHPGDLFGLNADDSIDFATATIGTLDASYDTVTLAVDSSFGLVTLGDGGSLSAKFGTITIDGSSMYLFVGDAGLNEGIGANINVVPEPATICLLGLGGLLLGRNRKSNKKQK
jgi:hypothetical protein